MPSFRTIFLLVIATMTSFFECAPCNDRRSGTESTSNTILRGVAGLLGNKANLGGPILGNDVPHNEEGPDDEEPPVDEGLVDEPGDGEGSGNEEGSSDDQGYGDEEGSPL
ncbi:hypothetical protein H2248_004086 [Termitomyces sp. 'cryptogamus']|nr:hypothetical protein H2248_004086 [Termitomyces sp. 'cryptogamus']